MFVPMSQECFDQTPAIWEASNALQVATTGQHRIQTLGL
jgi:hypothetical protein